ncbi:MAG: permease-like cell division protein FtsX [Elusimicrobia bacterium]|nr:permease-like cell division protein FtsX [Elusimicrobiota bacterium]
MGARARAAWVFAFAAAAALAAQSLLLVEGQCRRLEIALRDDFRVVLFLRGPLEESKRDILKEKLLASPEAADVRYVSPEESLAALRRDDPDLADSVALVGENPLPGAFEVKPAPEALPRLAAWISTAEGMADWSDVRWKPAQLQAILRARLYAHWLRLTLSTLFCAAAALALWALFGSLRGGARDGRLPWIGAAGGTAGLALAALAAWPLRRDGLLWVWPAAWTQIAVVAGCAMLGWSLSLWRGEA